MRLLFDANLSPELSRRLQDLYPGSAHVFSLGLGPDDMAIWSHARSNDYMIVSKDGDFYRMSTVFGAPPKVIWLRVGNDGTDAIEAALRKNHADIDNLAADAAAALLILYRR